MKRIIWMERKKVQNQNQAPKKLWKNKKNWKEELKDLH